VIATIIAVVDRGRAAEPGPDPVIAGADRAVALAAPMAGAGAVVVVVVAVAVIEMPSEKYGLCRMRN